MNFEITDSAGNVINLTCSDIAYNGNIRGNGRAWYTLTGPVRQNDNPVLYAIYPYASWKMDNTPLSNVFSVTVNPLTNGDVDIYID